MISATFDNMTHDEYRLWSRVKQSLTDQNCLVAFDSYQTVGRKARRVILSEKGSLVLSDLVWEPLIAALSLSSNVSCNWLNVGQLEFLRSKIQLPGSKQFRHSSLFLAICNVHRQWEPWLRDMETNSVFSHKKQYLSGLFFVRHCLRTTCSRSQDLQEKSFFVFLDKIEMLLQVRQIGFPWKFPKEYFPQRLFQAAYFPFYERFLIQAFAEDESY